MEEKMDVMLKLLSLMHTDFTRLQTDFTQMQSDFKAMQSDISEVKSDVAEVKTQTAKNTKKIDQLVKHAIKSDERFDRIEQQMFGIGVELKEENKELDQRVTNLEKEVFQGLTH